MEFTGPYSSVATIVPLWRREDCTKFVPVTVNVNAADGVVTLSMLVLAIVGGGCVVARADFGAAANVDSASNGAITAEVQRIVRDSDVTRRGSCRFK